MKVYVVRYIDKYGEEVELGEAVAYGVFQSAFISAKKALKEATGNYKELTPYRLVGGNGELYAHIVELRVKY